MTFIEGRPLVLASTSRTRWCLLTASGLDIESDPPEVDETAVKETAGDLDAFQLASLLSETKALAVSVRRPESLIIGADQILVCDGVRFDKPADRSNAHDQLRFLRGRHHQLLSGIALVFASKVLWRHVGVADLWMRSFSDSFLEDYLDRVGPDVLSSVGAYHLEGLGGQLFQTVRGDYFTILGLPLLELLHKLRELGVLPA